MKTTPRAWLAYRLRIWAVLLVLLAIEFAWFSRTCHFGLDCGPAGAQSGLECPTYDLSVLFAAN